MTAETFGNYRKPKSYGYGSFGMVTTMLGFIGLLAAMLLAFLWNIVPALVFAAVWFLCLGLSVIPDSHDRTLIQKLGTRMSYNLARRARKIDYISGPTTRFGSFRLPGILAQTELTEHTTVTGEPFGLLHYPRQHTYVVAFACEPDGVSLLNTSDASVQIARWALFLETMGIEPDLRQMQVSIETLPDTGSSLRQSVTRRRADHVPNVADEVMDLILNTYPTTSAQINSWVTLTYRSGGRDRQAMADHLAKRLPQIARDLSITGAGYPVPVDALAFSQMARAAYDPAAGAAMAAAEPTETVVRWTDAGPAAAHTGWDHYHADSGWSVTMGMSEGPQSSHGSHVLNALLEPHPDITRKRVTIIYRPMSPSQSVILASKDITAAKARINTSRNPSARASLDLTSATATASEEAKGAVLVDFTMLVTITMADQESLSRARDAITMTAPVSRIRLRPLNGSQDSAFALALPVGAVGTDYTIIPAGLREGL